MNGRDAKEVSDTLTLGSELTLTLVAGTYHRPGPAVARPWRIRFSGSGCISCQRYKQ